MISSYSPTKYIPNFEDKTKNSNMEDMLEMLEEHLDNRKKSATKLKMKMPE